jgi:hypothetical protein
MMKRPTEKDTKRWNGIFSECKRISTKKKVKSIQRVRKAEHKKEDAVKAEVFWKRNLKSEILDEYNGLKIRYRKLEMWLKNLYAIDVKAENFSLHN